MSATTEKLLEEIKFIEDELSRSTAPDKAADHFRLSSQLKELRKQLGKANEALTEGKQTLLKG